MALVDKKKLGALVDKAGKKKQPPQKKPGGGPPPFAKKGGGDGNGGDGGEHDDKKKKGGDQEEKKVDVHEIAEQIDRGDGDEQLMQLTDGYDPEQDGNPPAWVEDEDIWEKAKKAVEPNEDSYDNKWAVIAHVYKEMGGEVNGGDSDEEPGEGDDEG